MGIGEVNESAKRSERTAQMDDMKELLGAYRAKNKKKKTQNHSSMVPQCVIYLLPICNKAEHLVCNRDY